MNRITLKDFRCFHEIQGAKLAPLTLLVGENSTGKTSFMAMVRALWDIAYGQRLPDFTEDPYDLGSFDEIAHYRGTRGGRTDTFEGGFETTFVASPDSEIKKQESETLKFSVAFGRRDTVPVPVRRRVSGQELWIQEQLEGNDTSKLSFGTKRGSWILPIESHITQLDLFSYSIRPLFLSLLMHVLGAEDESRAKISCLSGSPEVTREDIMALREFLGASDMMTFTTDSSRRPYASAPVRSKPRRTYERTRSISGPEGDHVPMYLANIFVQDPKAWERLKTALEEFGRSAGLFDEISIKQLGKKHSEPFQIQIRKFGSRFKGPRRNLIDVGYGVSQALPVITELLRVDAPPTFLLQQPEVHLHPSAQAALGSLFCKLARPDRCLIVETHSDHLLDRVRMDIRDKTSELQSKDVSILFFQRTGLEVHIHSLELDDNGNILYAPDDYRRFFLAETNRSLGL